MADAFSAKKKEAGGRGTAGGRERSRIALTTEKIRAEAERTLAGEAPVILRPKPAGERMALPDLARGLSPEERRDLAEIADAEGRVLLCMPLREALRQGLRPRLAAVALRGPGNTVILRKYGEDSKDRQGLWDLYTGAVRPGEAVRDAAERVLSETAGLSGLHPRPLPFAAGQDCAWASISLFAAALPPGQHPKSAPKDLLPLDADELAGLLRDAREFFTPELLLAADHGALFNAGAG